MIIEQHEFALRVEDCCAARPASPLIHHVPQFVQRRLRGLGGFDPAVHQSFFRVERGMRVMIAIVTWIVGTPDVRADHHSAALTGSTSVRRRPVARPDRAGR